MSDVVERDGGIKIGDTALDSPSEREIARRERMKREDSRAEFEKAKARRPSAWTALTMPAARAPGMREIGPSEVDEVASFDDVLGLISACRFGDGRPDILTTARAGTYLFFFNN